MSDITVTGTFYPSALDLSAKSEIDVFFMRYLSVLMAPIAR